MRAALIIAFLALAGCDEPPGTPPDEALYRWGQGPYSAYPSDARIERPSGVVDLEISATPPAELPEDAAVLIDASATLVDVRQGDQPLPTSRMRIAKLPDRHAPVIVHYRTDRDSVTPLEIRFGSTEGLMEGDIRRSVPEVLCGLTLALLGIVVMLLGLRRYARAYLWLGLFTFANGVIGVCGGSVWRLALWDDAAGALVVRAICIYVYAYAFTLFVEQVFAPSGDRLLRFARHGLAAAFALSVALQLAGVATLDRTRRWTFVAILIIVARIIWLMLVRVRQGDTRARIFLGGFAAMVLTALPGFLSTITGIGVAPISETYGVLLLVAALIVLVERDVDRQRKALAHTTEALEQRVEELTTQKQAVQELNAELRHQVAARSRDLADLLGVTSIRARVPEPGERIGDRYIIRRVIGRGGMGVVLEVERTTDGGRFALKVMSQVPTPKQAERFAREAEIAAQLDHDNLVSVVDAGISDGQLFLVMRLIEGGSLDAERARFGDVGWALPILGEIAVGLTHLHARGIVHRDLKPGNILLAPSPGGAVAKISDFGIARRDDIEQLTATLLADDIDATHTMTHPDATRGLIGTPLYMAPELAFGVPAGPEADIFAFAAMAYQMLSGGYPFAAPAIQLAVTGVALAPAPLLLPDHRLAALLRAALDADPTHRPTAAELAAAFAEQTAGPQT